MTNRVHFWSNIPGDDSHTSNKNSAGPRPGKVTTGSSNGEHLHHPSFYPHGPMKVRVK